MAASPIGVFGLLFLFLFGTGLPLPLGVPPRPEDPALLMVAPPETLLFLEWFGSAEPKGDSVNASEKLAANAEVRRLIADVKAALRKAAEREAPPSARVPLREGLDLLELILERPGCLFISGLDLPPKPFRLAGGLAVNVAGKAADVDRSLRDLESFFLREMGGERAPPVSTLQAEGVAFRSLPIPPGAPPAAWGISGDHLVLAIGEGMPEAMVKGLRAGPGLGGNEGFRKLQGLVRVERPCSRMYVDIAQLLEKASSLQGGPEVGRILDVLGLTSVTAAISESGLEGQGFLSKGFISVRGVPRGLLRLVDGPPLTAGELAIVPGDAAVAAAFRLNLSTVYREFLAVLGQIDVRARGQFVEEVEGNVERGLGLALLEDVFEPLGDAWCLWNSPGDGGLIVTGATLAVTVKDRGRLEKTLDKVVEAMRREMGQRQWDEGRRGKPRGIHVESFTFQGTRIHFLNAVGEEMPIAPAWCLTDRHLLVSLYPQMLKSVLARGGDAGRSLARQPAWKDQNAIALSYLDAPEIFKLVYPILHPLAQMACSRLQREGVDVTIASMPAASALLPFLSPEVSSVERTAEGVLATHRGSLPRLEGLGMALAGIVPIMFFRRAAPMRPAEMTPVPPPPPPPR